MILNVRRTARRAEHMDVRSNPLGDATYLVIQNKRLQHCSPFLCLGENAGFVYQGVYLCILPAQILTPVVLLLV